MIFCLLYYINTLLKLYNLYIINVRLYSFKYSYEDFGDRFYTIYVRGHICRLMWTNDLKQQRNFIYYLCIAISDQADFAGTRLIVERSNSYYL